VSRKFRETVPHFRKSENFFLKKPCVDSYSRNLEVFLCVYRDAYLDIFPENFAGTTSQKMYPWNPVFFGFFTKNAMLCHFNSMHYVNFEEIWSDFPKFRKFQGKPSENRAEIWENFSWFPNSKFGKVCAFSCFSQNTLAAGYTGKINRYKRKISEKSSPKILENPEFPKTVFSRFFSGFSIRRKDTAYFCKNFAWNFPEIRLFSDGNFLKLFASRNLKSEKCENGHFREIQHTLRRNFWAHFKEQNHQKKK
jgi:hypothetical protein